MSARIPTAHPLPLAVIAGMSIANARDAAATLDRVTWAVFAAVFIVCSLVLTKTREAPR